VQAQLLVIVVKRRVKLMRPMDAAAIDDHHDLFARFPKDMHDLMEILAQLLGIKMGHDLIEDFRGPIGSLVFPGVQNCDNINKLCLHVHVLKC